MEFHFGSESLNLISCLMNTSLSSGKYYSHEWSYKQLDTV